MPVVFISYSHDSDAHRDKVLAFAQRLRTDGFDSRLDQFLSGGPTEGWPRWMLDQLDAAQFVLLVCTETYYRRFRGHEVPGKGKGVDWEGSLITTEVYHACSKTLKFVPVIFSDDDTAFIPEPLRGLTHYPLTSEDRYAALLDFLAGRAGVAAMPVGTLATRPQRVVQPLVFSFESAALSFPPQSLGGPALRPRGRPGPAGGVLERGQGARGDAGRFRRSRQDLAGG